MIQANTYKSRNAANLNKAVVIADVGFVIDNIHWYVPHYTPGIKQQAISSKQILSNFPTELQYVDRSVFMNKVNTQNQWTFKLGSQEGVNVLIGIIIGVQQRDRRALQNLNIDSFQRASVTSAECNRKLQRCWYITEITIMIIILRGMIKLKKPLEL